MLGFYPTPVFADSPEAIGFQQTNGVQEEGEMWKLVRELQPAHESNRFTVEEAARAFRQVRTSPIPSIFDQDAVLRRDASGRLMIYDPEPAAADVVEPEKPGARKPFAGMAYRKGVLRRW